MRRLRALLWLLAISLALEAHVAVFAKVVGSRVSPGISPGSHRRRIVSEGGANGGSVGGSPAAVEGLSRKAKPCFQGHCWRPHMHTQKVHPAWIPVQNGWEDHPRRIRTWPPNRHSGGTGRMLDWVIPRGNSTPGYEPREWQRLRPHGDVVGPEVLSCRSVEPFKFYLMEEALPQDCKVYTSGEQLTSQVVRGGAQHLGELFFYWQLKNHTWRTHNPDEAQLVVVPFFPTMLLRGACGPTADALDKLVDALEAFPRYHRNAGKDFAMISTDFLPQTQMFGGSNRRFVKATENFIYVSRLNGKFSRVRHIQSRNRCVVAAPYTSQHALSKCVGNSSDGLECPGLEDLEQSFDEFMQRRNLTMFFMGQADHRIAYQSRRLLVTQVPHLRAPNYMVAQTRHRGAHPMCPAGRSSNWNGCFYMKARTSMYKEKISSAKLSIMAGGDDPTTSRFYDAMVFGTPQIIISEGFYDQGAPFRCAVDHASIAYYLNEVDFHYASYKYMSEALDQLLKDDAKLLRKKWEAQRAAAPDLLWHVPGSRVAQNLLEDIFRRCLTDLRGNNDAAK